MLRKVPLLVAGTPLTSISILSASASVCGSLRVISPDVGDAGLLQLVLQALDDLVGVGLEGVLQLHLQHQLAAAVQIEPEMDVVLPVVDQFAFATWEGR